jgi:hypothetical protein
MARIADSWVESIDVSRGDGGIAVTVGFRRDREFEAEVATFIRELEAGRQDGLQQPATRRAARIRVIVTPVDGDRPRSDCIMMSGGTGTENIAVWKFKLTPMPTTEFKIVIQADGQTIYEAPARIRTGPD